MDALALCLAVPKVDWYTQGPRAEVGAGFSPAGAGQQKTWM